MENNTKSQVVERLKEAKNILVTVNANPTVDQLAAALGITLLMNKIDKRATAVFSGEIPSTLEFLSPEDTIETNTDSLRDFIIALDKSKADKLKYKFEDEVVKVFITPYKTSLTEADLSFSQGDFNVDVVLALGVRDRDQLDKAITAHGRILHDATVIGVSNDYDPIEIGSLNWQDSEASSLCQMLASIASSLKKDAIDGQIATAFLTGIVAETERFSNDKTTPGVMSLSATLMSAGANQQLISNELTLANQNNESNENDDNETDSGELPAPVTEDIVSEDGTLTLSHVGEDAIHIDDTGNFKSADELNAAVNEVQENAQKTQDSQQDDLDNNSVIQEVKEDSKPRDNSGYSHYVGSRPPENPINSNILSPDEQPMVDPLAEIPTSTPVDEIAPKKVENTESPLLTTQHDAESPPATTVPSTPDPSNRLTTDGESVVQASSTKPLGPEVKETETLEDIEKKVLSYEESAQANLPQPNVDDAEAARQAVLNAMDEAGNFNPDRPEPLESMGAVEFPSPQLENENETPIGDEPAPEVPPPFIPPFPTYEPNDSNNQQN